MRFWLLAWHVIASRSEEPLERVKRLRAELAVAEAELAASDREAVSFASWAEPSVCNARHRAEDSVAAAGYLARQHGLRAPRLGDLTSLARSDEVLHRGGSEELPEGGRLAWGAVRQGLKQLKGIDKSNSAARSKGHFATLLSCPLK